MIMWLLLVALMQHPECTEPSFIWEDYGTSTTIGWVFEGCEISATQTFHTSGEVTVEIG